jgi:hypothetical protein
MKLPMNLDKWIKCCALGLIILASGCNTVTALSVGVIEHGYMCAINQPAGVQLVSDSASIQADSSRIDETSQTNRQGREAEQGSFWIVRVNMGQQPSGGYALRLKSNYLEISSDTARVALEWLRPESDSVQIQALTYPCLYLKVAKGDYTRLDIVDQKGQVRYSLDLN